MAETERRRRQLLRQRQNKQLDAEQCAATAAAARFQRLPPELLAEIHHRLDFLSGLAFASVCGLKLETPPWLLLPGPKEYDAKATVLSLADGESATVRTSDVALRGHVVIGSSGGWLVTTDDRAALRMANPVTGAHADLPPISTVPFIQPHYGGGWFFLDFAPFLQMRFGGSPPPPEHRHGQRTPAYTVTAAQMRQLVYRKVVLSASPHPGSYAAMLIMDRSIGAPAFASAEDAAWRMAPTRGDVEDAIHHGGRFLSITYTGHVQAWQRNVDTGEFTGDAAVAPRLSYKDKDLRRKYLAVSTDGRLMVVLKHSRDEENTSRRYRSISMDTRVFFKVQILDHDKGRWEEAADIGDAAIFVGVNGSLCLSTTEHQGIMPGCVYFTDDDVGGACLRNGKSSNFVSLWDELRDVGVYSLKAGRVEKIDAVGKHLLWPPPAWFTPSFL
ncbi:uncharacterized protein LOC8083391 [Sorghum bicolor]|uniref:KIB1-4 beta-propeller domain-containing protein n=1 Tax=Sorghum bicolor TaxID=4558 RepID=C5YC70_SORBI|nr:uncharacterized protein LOC8083391 [Sorghum bicolor]EES11798.1 hypothetical protein SORBI_3006G015700 [Sorghum bicolor]|eukprot:XP_002447470.1 uncharacterized protein LOC8083391 [Sorghum bicolor]